MRRFLLLLAMALLTTCALASIWLPLSTSTQEAAAHAVKATDFFDSITSAGHLLWWSPHFLGGTSLASAWHSIATYGWIGIWTHLFGPIIGLKLAALLCLPIAACSMYWFARRVTGSSTAAFIAGLVYFLAPSLLVRLADVGPTPDHIVSMCAMAIIPLVAVAVFYLSEAPRTFSSLLFAGACSLLILTYGTAATLLAPSLLVFALWALWKNCGLAAWLSPKVLWPALIGLFLLGVLPLTPSIRESSSWAHFDFSPLEYWRHFFSSKSGLVAIDRLSGLSVGFREDFNGKAAFGGAYLGIIPLLLCGGALIGRGIFLKGYNQPLPSAFRIGLALALLSFWLSCGPYSVLTGHFHALDASLDGYDFTPALMWALLGLQVAIIYWLMPSTMPLRMVFGTLLSAGYLLLPGFRLLSALPLFEQIRSPLDFFQVCGPVWIALATGSAGALILQYFQARRLRAILAGLLALVWALDLSGYVRYFQSEHLPAELESRFLAAAQAIKAAPRPGAILTFSGRHFSLRLPALTGKSLSQETFQDYFQQKSYTALWKTALASDAMLDPFLRATGVTYILYDKNDSDATKPLYTVLSAHYPLLFENEGFAVLEVKSSLAPAYIAEATISLDLNDLKNLPPALDAMEQNVLPIGISFSGSSLGTIRDGEISWTTDTRNPTPFQRLANDAVTWLDNDSFTVSPEDAKGWLVIPQAWHRDWTAEQNGSNLEIYRALGALPAVQIRQPGLVTFRFQPPWWYSPAILISGASWAALLLFVSAILVFPRLRSRLGLDKKITLLQPPSSPIEKALVICPTYNEKESVRAVLDAILLATPRVDILIVDDASPDGTASLVKAHPDFGSRVYLLERSGKLGLGTAYREGFQWAKKQGYPACMEIDADLSHDPHDIPALLDALDAGADAAIGSRYLNGLRVVNWPPHRLLLSSTATQFVRLMTGLPLTDSTSGFKALRLSALDKLDWQQLRAEGYGFQVELHYFLWKSGARLVEVPITFTERRDGHTKMTAGIAVEALKRVLQLTLRRNAPMA